MKTPSRLGHSADLELADRDRSIPALACLLDDDGLSALLGENVRVTRVRYKPGTSVLAAFIRSGSGPDQYGWAMARATGYGEKLYDRAGNSRCAAGNIRILQLGPRDLETAVAVGGVEDDWPLRKNLRWLWRSGLELLHAPEFPPAEAAVLRYKPERRLVVRLSSEHGPIIVKTAAQPYPNRLEPAVRKLLAGQGVPLLPELADDRCLGHGISASPQWGDGDLDDGDGTSAYQAGAALAALHQAGLPPSAREQTTIQSTTRPALARELLGIQSAVAALLPELEEVAARLRLRLQERLGARAGQLQVLVHGDFSADQVLVSGDGVRLIDFDRMALAEPEADIGSFAAAELIRSRNVNPTTHGWITDGQSLFGQLTAGYSEAGGSMSPDRVDLWTACRLFRSCLEPFRDRAADWPASMHWHLERALELVA